MKAIKLCLAVMMIIASMELAGTGQVQAKPTSAYQIAVRIGDRPHRRFHRRPVFVHRPMHRRWHRGPYRRY